MEVVGEVHVEDGIEEIVVGWVVEEEVALGEVAVGEFDVG